MGSASGPVSELFAVMNALKASLAEALVPSASMVRVTGSTRVHDSSLCG